MELARTEVTPGETLGVVPFIVAILCAVVPIVTNRRRNR